MNAQPELFGTDQAEFVSFVSGGQGYCIEVARVREIRRWSPVTTLPHAPRYFLGVMNLRGAVIPIIDLALRLGLAATAPTPDLAARIGDLLQRLGRRDEAAREFAIAERLQSQPGRP
jgi:chemotaxis signal transduction protein